MVAVPPPTMVTVVPATVATEVFELEYVKAPVLLEVGAVRVNGASPKVLLGTEKLVIVGGKLLITSDAVIVPALNKVVAACDAVIVTVPNPKMVTVVPEMDASAVFELVYVIAPVLFEVGGVIANGGFPTFLEGIVKFENAGFPLLTTSEAVVVPAK